MARLTVAACGVHPVAVCKTTIAGNHCLMKYTFSAALAALAVIAAAPALAGDEPRSAREAQLHDRFITLTDGFLVAGQLRPEDIDAAKALGVTLIINNRPDGEALGQPKGEEIEKAAKAAGLSYVAIPVGPMGVGDRHLDALDAALADNAGGALAFCRTGMRSAMVWALARARAGDLPDEIIREAAGAGYDISRLAPRLQALSGAARR